MSGFARYTASMLRQLALDRFTLMLLAAVVLASFLPIGGFAAEVLGTVTTVAIALLFFLHGARLSREAVRAGAMHWRLHLVVLAATFVMFPLLGLALEPLALALLTPDLYLGILFLCTLPSTVQSSVSFTALARGNVAAAICSASASNFLGTFLTPALVGALVIGGAAAGGSSLDAVKVVVIQLLLPFVAGQLLRPWIGAWVDSRKKMLTWVDQGAIVLMVYTAFSESVQQGLWTQLSLPMLGWLCLFCCLIMAVAIGAATFASRRLGFNKQDEITIVFCGSKKSMANGIPIAKLLFAPGTLGMIILPVMLFHQIQLMVSAVLAQHFARRPG